jgi:hypothetical protein
MAMVVKIVERIGMLFFLSYNKQSCVATQAPIRSIRYITMSCLCSIISPYSLHSPKQSRVEVGEVQITLT